ncbi:beta strand repeat-containing protein, partial [Roseomonas elaeocarpi]
MATPKVTGSLPATIIENSSASDWIGYLSLGAGSGVTEVALTGAAATLFNATLDTTTGQVTITPARLLDREAYAAGADPVLSFGLQVRINGTWQDLGTTYGVTLVGVDDTPPSDLSFSTGGQVLESEVGAVIGTLRASDPDTDPANLTYTVAYPDDGRFEVVNGTTLKLRDGVDLLRSGGSTIEVAVVVSDGHQDATMLVPVQVLNTTTVDDTPALPTASVADASIAEGNSGTTALNFTVSLSYASASPVTLRWDAVSGTAVSGSDFDAAGGTVTIPAGQTSATVTVNIRGDTAVEADETFRLVLSQPSGATLDRAEAVGTIRNDDLPAASVADVSVAERNSGTAAMTFTISLSQASTLPVTLRWDAVSGTATAGSDFDAAGGTVTIPAGQTSATVTVNIRGDTTYEADETFRLVLSSPTNATLSRAEATGTIRNDDAPPTVSIADASITEGNSGTTAMTFTVTLSQASALPVTLRWDAVSGTATAGSDFDAAGGTVTIPAGQTSATVTVNVRGDTTYEADESFRVVLSQPTGATLARAEATGTIRNDDALPTVSIADASVAEGSGTSVLSFTVTLSQASALPVTLRWDALSGTATAGSDFDAGGGTVTLAAGQTSATVNVAIHGDTLYGPDETLRLVLSQPSGATLARAEAVGTIRNDDAPPTVSIADASVAEGNGGTTAMNFTVTLSQASTLPVTLRWDAVAGTATAGSDFDAAGGTVTIPAGQTSAVVTVNVRGDTLYEADETFRVVLSQPSGATLARAEATGTIRNDDAAPTVSIADASITEGNSGTTAMTFTVTLSQASALPVTLRWDAVSGTATAGSDFDAAGGTVTIPAGQTSATVAVNVRGDTLYEADETFRVVLSSPTNATLSRAEAVGTIRNDDAAPTVSIADVSVAEGNSGTTAVNFTVTLSQVSNLPVTLRWDAVSGTATAGSDFDAAGGTVTIPAGQTSATVTVNVRGDTTYEADETFRLVLSSPTNATLSRAEATGTIRNDDAFPVTAVSPGTSTEGLIFGRDGTAVLDALGKGTAIGTGTGSLIVARADGTLDGLSGVRHLVFDDGTLEFSGTATSSVVNRLYSAILGREADAGGIGYYTALVDSG